MSEIQVGQINSTDGSTAITTGAGGTVALSAALTGTDATLSGGVYLGGTGSANYLDDYEEGTWTPSNAGTATISASVGRYTKVGRVVIAEFELTYNSNGSAILGSLPFTASSDDRSIGAAREDNTGGLMWQIIANASSTNAQLQSYDNSSNVVSGNGIRATLTYYID